MSEAPLVAVWTHPGLAWMDDAACADEPTELFFPQSEQAKSICDRCTVRGECLSFALVNNIEHGMWGGTSRKERRRIRAQTNPHTNRKDPNAETVSASS